MREAKRLNPKAQILVITAYDRFSYAQGALRLGARDLFLKPLDRHELETCLQAIAREIPDEPQPEEEQQYRRDELYQKLLDTLNEQFRRIFRCGGWRKCTMSALPIWASISSG